MDKNMVLQHAIQMVENDAVPRDEQVHKDYREYPYNMIASGNVCAIPVFTNMLRGTYINQVCNFIVRIIGGHYVEHDDEPGSCLSVHIKDSLVGNFEVIMTGNKSNSTSVKFRECNARITMRTAPRKWEKNDRVRLMCIALQMRYGRHRAQ